MDQDDACEKMKEPPVSADRWDQDLLAALDWKRFQWLCSEVLESAGFTTLSPEDEGDGGADFDAYRTGEDDSPTVAVYCLQKSAPVGVGDIRQYLRKATGRGCPQVLVLTSGDFTESARAAYDEDPGVELVDGRQMLEGIEDLGAEDAEALLETATEGEDWHVPTCPECKIKMVPRVSGKPAEDAGNVYWGCRNYFSPNPCHRTFSVDEELALPS